MRVDRSASIQHISAVICAKYNGLFSGFHKPFSSYRAFAYYEAYIKLEMFLSTRTPTGRDFAKKVTSHVTDPKWIFGVCGEKQKREKVSLS